MLCRIGCGSVMKQRSVVCYVWRGLCRSHDECYVVGTGETEGGGYGSGVGH